MKDAYWFKHDSNAKDDHKCMMLIDQLGLEGYGIYWILVETLRDQSDYKYPLRMLPILAKRYMTSHEKMLAVVQNYELFTVNEDNFFFSDSLLKRMLHYDDKREKARQAGLESGKKRKALGTSVERPLNDASTIREEKRREEEIIKEYIRENNLQDEFVGIVQLWLAYKKEKKQTYKPIGLKTFLKKLHEYSEGNINKASVIVDTSISNNWAGIFELKQLKQEGKTYKKIDFDER